MEISILILLVVGLFIVFFLLNKKINKIQSDINKFRATLKNIEGLIWKSTEMISRPELYVKKEILTEKKKPISKVPEVKEYKEEKPQKDLNKKFKDKETRNDSISDSFEEDSLQSNPSNVMHWNKDDLGAPPKRKVVYYPGPIEERCFAKNDGSEIKKARFVYKIEIEPSGTSGKLILDPTQSDLEIIKNFPESILQRACEYANPFTVNFKGIVQIAPGKVSNDGDNWFVKEKVIIEFK